ncbi:hypothetical protein TNCV_233061 [Trichonephila clavipes]|nr:hypothetical protein TNCV_233061 [Trichonephila clavipes]
MEEAKHSLLSGVSGGLFSPLSKGLGGPLLHLEFHKSSARMGMLFSSWSSVVCVMPDERILQYFRGALVNRSGEMFSPSGSQSYISEGGNVSPGRFSLHHPFFLRSSVTPGLELTTQKRRPRVCDNDHFGTEIKK